MHEIFVNFGIPEVLSFPTVVDDVFYKPIIFLYRNISTTLFYNTLAPAPSAFTRGLAVVLLSFFCSL